MDEGWNLDDALAHARDEVERLLGLDEPDPGALFELAAAELGDLRAARCSKLVRRGPLTRRDAATACVAVLVVGTRSLGDRWWAPRGDELLATPGEDPLRALAARIADDCADERWGPSIGFVDINDPRMDDRVQLPPGARDGDTFVATWDPGCRVEVTAVDRDGVLGSVLGDLREDDTAGIDWAWAMALHGGPVRLPGEVPGTRGDPFARPLDERAARVLRGWAERHEPDRELLGDPWHTRGELWDAYFRLDVRYGRGGDWHPFEIAARAAVDGDPDQLAYTLARLQAP